MKTAVSVPDELYARAERAASRLGTTRSALYAEALAAFLDDLDGRGGRLTAALDAVYGDDGHVGETGAGPAAGRDLVDAGRWEW